MVTAGVYLVARAHVLFENAPDVQRLGGRARRRDAADGGRDRLVQTDIKRIIAYSTMSQIGYMFAAVGAGAYAAGMFHLLTHAFFKALLFLGAGIVIHALADEQDVRKMGGLAKAMPAHDDADVGRHDRADRVLAALQGRDPGLRPAPGRRAGDGSSSWAAWSAPSSPASTQPG